MKKYLSIFMIICIVSVIVMPGISSAAVTFPAGVLRGVAGQCYFDETHPNSQIFKTAFTDGDDTTIDLIDAYDTRINAGCDNYMFPINSAAQIKSYYFHASNSGGTLELGLMTSGGSYTKLLDNSQLNRSGQWINISGPSMSGKAYFVVKSTGTSYEQIYDFDVFTTNELNPPANPTSLSTSNITETSMTVKFTTPSDADFDKYKVYANGVLKYTSAAGASKSTATSYNITGLTSATFYTIKVTSVDTSGNESTGATTTATTLIPPDTAAPPVPGGLHVTNVTMNAASLAWNAVTDTAGGTVSGMKGYFIYKNGVKQNATPQTGTTYNATGLTVGVSYSWQVSAIDNAGNESAKSGAVTSLYGVPAAPTGVSSFNLQEHTVTISWTAASGSAPIQGYNVYRDGVKQNGALISATNYNATGLIIGQVYSWQISAVDENGYEGAKSTAIMTQSTDMTAPSKPTDFKVINGNKGASISWTASTDNVGVIGYNVFLDGVKKNTTPITGTTYDFTGLTNYQSYTLEVSAVDAAGNESPTASVTAVPFEPDITPPAKPTGLMIAAGDKRGTISWNENVDPDLAGYLIYLSGVKQTPTPITATTFNFTGLNNGTAYTVGVSAVDTSGNESQKTIATLTPVEPDTTPPGKPTGLKAKSGNTEAFIEWQPNPEPDIAGYEIFVGGTKITATPIMAAYTYVVSGLTNGQTYNIQIRAIDTSGNESPLSDLATVKLDNRVPDRPSTFFVTSGDSRATLSWSPVNSQSVDHYEIFRNGVKIATITGTEYTDKSVSNGGTYEYQVTAVNGFGSSAPSVGHAGPQTNLTDFRANPLPFDVFGMFKLAFDFLKMYGVWILLALGVIFAMAMLETPKKTVDHAKKKGRSKQTRDERSKKIKEKLNEKPVNYIGGVVVKTKGGKEYLQTVKTKAGSSGKRKKAEAKAESGKKPREKRSREGLIAKQIPAERNGKKYMTTVYVKPENYRQGNVIYTGGKKRK